MEHTKYLAAIGKKGGLAGGKSQSAAKQAAAKANGAKGGRPRNNPKPLKGQKIKIRFAEVSDAVEFFERLGQPMKPERAWHEVEVQG
jgi:hypothetical protein